MTEKQDPKVVNSILDKLYRAIDAQNALSPYVRASIDHYLNLAYSEGWYNGYGEGYDDCKHDHRDELSSKSYV